VVSQRSFLCTGSHEHTAEAFDIYAKQIVVEVEARVATDVFIASGITNGKGAVIGARISVFKDMPAVMICIGNPAKLVKKA
jgi:putative colanic acid biosynthesis acetyltransferase WcaF